MKQYRVLVVAESQDADEERIETMELFTDCTGVQAMRLVVAIGNALTTMGDALCAGIGIRR